MQFLIEAVVISVFGGIDWRGARVRTSRVLPHYQQWPTLVPPDAAFTAMGFSAGVGIFLRVLSARESRRAWIRLTLLDARVARR
jgi:hypothetical protein